MLDTSPNNISPRHPNAPICDSVVMDLEPNTITLLQVVLMLPNRQCAYGPRTSCNNTTPGRLIAPKSTMCLSAWNLMQ